MFSDGFLVTIKYPIFNSAYIIDRADNKTSTNFKNIAQESQFFTFADEEYLEKLEVELSRNEVEAIIILPATFGQPNQNKQATGQLKLIYN